MESVGMGAFMDGEWESLCRMLSFDESNFGDHFVTFPADDDNNFHNPLNYLFSHGNNSNLSDSTSYNNFPSKTSYDTSHLNLSPCNEFEFLGGNDSFRNTCYLQENEGELLVSPFPLDSLIIEPELAGDSDQSACQGSPMSTPEIQLKRRYIAPEVEATPVKKGRISKHKGKNTVQSDLQSEETEDNMTNAGSSTHCPTHENSDNEESNASQRTSDGENSASKELMGSVTNSKGSKRASRGKATDPQSLYARRRRQRINERLRILQNLVPNGTKVDISTMLEEAVHYVKFLKLQLKLLSSDDLWMYAPIAYNGVDINLCRKISPFQLH